MDSVGLKSQALAAWEAHAESWDGLMGDSGNKYFSVLELPILDRMALGRNGAYALDLATGNGLVARWLAQEGASVIATDGSRPMLEQAKARTESWYQQGKLNHDRKISFEVLDVMDPQCWDAFISRSLETCDGFDIITMNMALMDIPDLKPLAIALKRLLKPSACFVATLLHPLFFTSGADRQINVHENPVTGEREVTRSIVLKHYMSVPPARQLLFWGNGEAPPPFSFHRPLHELFVPFFQAGLVLDALEEMNFDESYRNPVREYSSNNFTQFPKILGFRLRPSGS